jgi:glycosyltransferase involved in cell wall biosynthesis
MVVDRRYRLILPHKLLDRTGPIWRTLREEEPHLIEVCDKYSLCYLGGLIRRRWLTGKQHSAIRRTPGRVGLRVHLLGHTDGRDALADCYAHADVFVHPNPREPFGLAPLETMASGLPLVAPVSGGVLEYASAENAWLAEPTAAGFAAAVQCIAGGTSERHQKLERADPPPARSTGTRSRVATFGRTKRCTNAQRRPGRSRPRRGWNTFRVRFVAGAPA